MNTPTATPPSSAPVHVIKVGGAIVEDPASLASLLDTFCLLPGPKVLVHGGGRLATSMASRLGVETQMVGGRRITTDEMLTVVSMVYGGLVNKNIVAQLQARGTTAVGLTGADMNLLLAHRRPVTAEGVDFGWVGDVDRADGTPLRHLLAAGITPVIAPLTHDGQGHLLNTNADTMAAQVAQSLGPGTTLTFCFELPGVLRQPSDPTSVIPVIHEEDYAALVRDGIVTGGMIPKLDNAFGALHHGVERVVITSVTNLGGGTCLLP